MKHNLFQWFRSGSHAWHCMLLLVNFFTFSNSVFSQNYGLRDDDGVNLPSLTYWYSEQSSDITEKGSQFNAKNLGEISILTLKGTSVKVWKIAGGDVTGAQFKYKVWKDDEAEPSEFTTRQVGWSSNDYEDGNLVLQTWSNFGSNIEIATGLTGGTYSLKILFSISGTGTPGIVENGPFTATFQIPAVSSAAEILSFELDEQDGVANINSSQGKVDIQVIHGTSLLALEPTISLSPGATIDPESGVSQNFSSPVEYTVTAENGTSQKVWTVTVTEAPQKYSVTFNVDMTPAITNESFDPETDFVDVAGTFNGWSGSGAMVLSLENIFTQQTGAIFTSGQEISYKFRINGNWETSEFPGGDNRVCIVTEGNNIINNTYNQLISPEPEEITFVNLQWPDSVTVEPGTNVDVYAQVLVENGNVTESGIEGMQVWIGLSDTNSDPSLWTEWQLATWHGLSTVNENPEYKYILETNELEEGTYYFASRFKLNDEAYVYGGYSADGGGYWNGTSNVSGILNIENEILTYPVTFIVTNHDSEVTTVKTMGSYNGWSLVNMENTMGNQWTKTFDVQPGTHEWGISNQDNTWLLTGDNLEFALDSLGTITGQTTYTHGTPPETPEITFVNLQWPDSVTVEPGTNVDVYAQVLVENGNVTESGIEGMQVWIGLSDTNSDPSLWTEWQLATWHGLSTVNENPEYKYILETNELEEGTYYFASRFKLNDEAYVYGGYSADGGGYWNGTSNVSGILNIENEILTYPVTFIVTNHDSEVTTVKTMGSYNGWSLVNMENTMGNQWTKTFDVQPGTHQWGISNQDNTWLLTGDNLEFALDSLGTITGQTTYTHGTPPETPEITFVNLQWPDSVTVEPGTNVDVYAQVLVENGNVTESGIEGMQVWIGLSDTNSDPSLWTEWQLATWHGLSTVNENPEYKYILETNELEEGTYYFASRFKLNDEAYVYGGYSADGGGYWNGTSNVSGILNIENEILTYPITFTVTNDNPLVTQVRIAGSFNLWGSIDMEFSDPNLWTKTFDIPEGNDYQWGVADQDNQWLIVGSNLVFSVGPDGIVNGLTTYTIPSALPNYGLRDDEGANLPTITYWYSGQGSDITEKGLQFDQKELGVVESVVIKGTNIQSWKTGSGNVTGAQFNYKVWKEGDLEPENYTIRNVTWTSEFIDGDYVNQTWSGFGDEILLANGLASGVYHLKVLFSIAGEGVAGTIEDGPFTATFEIPSQSSAAEILSFVLAEQTGNATINSGEATVAIEVAHGTSLLALTPTIGISAGATISPESGVAQDFTNPVEYTVTAEDQTTQKVWTVTVTEAAPPAANYGLRDDEGVNLPTLTYWYSGQGNDITEKGSQFDQKELGVVESVVVKGANIQSWKTGAGNVTGAQFNYKVWKEGDSEPENYTIRNVTWTSEFVDGDYVNQTWSGFGDEILVAEGLASGMYNLKVLFSIGGEGVAGTTEDGPFVASFEIVEAESAAEILSFEFAEQTSDAIINSSEATVTIEVAHGTSLLALTPAIGISAGATISPESGMERDFSAPVTYTVTAEDLTEKVWTVTVTEADPPAANYGLRDDEGANLPTITYWYSGQPTDITEKGSEFDAKDLGVVESVVVKGANIQSWKTGAGNVTGAQFNYKVWKEGDSEPENYTVRNVSWTAEFVDGDYVNQTWSGFGDEIFIAEGLASGSYNLKVMFSIAGEGVAGTTEDGPFVASFEKVEAGTAAEILSFEFEEQTGDATINSAEATVTIEVAYGTDVTMLVPTIGISAGATISPESGVAQDFTNFVEYTVTAEDQTTQKVWTVTVTEANPPAANYGLRDDEGANLPTITYWYSGQGNDITEKGSQFDTKDLGVVESVVVKGANIQSWKTGAGNVTGAQFNYKVWKEGDSEPENYTVRNVSWTSEFVDGEYVNQTWSGFGDEILVAEGLASGVYNLKVLFSIAGEGVAGTTEDGPFTATFEIQSQSGAAEILSLVLAEQTGNANISSAGATVTIEVAYGTDVTMLVPTIGISAGATISPESGVAQDFTNPVEYTVTAEDQTTQKVWTVTVTEAAPPAANYGLRDDEGANLPTITYWYSGQGSDITEKGSQFDQKDLGVVESVVVKGTNIQSWKAGSGNVTGAQFNYKVWKEGDSEPENYTVRNVSWTAEFVDGDYVNQTWSGFGDEIFIAEGLASGSYNLKVMFSIAGEGVAGTTEDGPFVATFQIVELSSDAEIISFTVEGQIGETLIDSDQSTVLVNMPLETNVTALTPSIAISAGATISPESNVAQDFTNPVVYTVTAENQTQKVWTVAVNLVEQPVYYSVTFNVDMAPAIANSTFNPATDFVDVAGDFNGWSGSGAMQLVSGSMYSYTTEEIFEAGEILSFKFRINGSWATAEFPGGDNRSYTVVEGDNIVNAIYNQLEGVDPEITFANLHYPGSATIETGQSVDIFAQITVSNANVDPVNGIDGVAVWVGLNNENTDPSTWTNWFVAPYSGLGSFTNRPEYMASIGSDITEEGTYYYASRFQLNSGAFVYGGYSATGGGYWDGVSNISGQLIVANEIQYFPVTFTVTNENTSVTQVKIRGNFTSWSDIPMENNTDNLWVITLDVPAGIHEWGVTDQDGNWLVEGANLNFTMSVEGVVSGQITYTIPAEDPGTAEILDRWIIYTMGSSQPTTVSGSDFNNVDLGDFTPTNPLTLNGAGLKSFKSGIHDILGAKMFYRVYRQGNTPGEYIEVELPWNENLPEVGQQMWQESTLITNLTTGLVTGTYSLEVYFEAYYQVGTITVINTLTDNNEGQNYKAIFAYNSGVGIRDNALSNNVLIYPNPVCNVVNIMTLDQTRFEKVRLYDTRGVLLTESTENQIDISGFPNGVFFIEVLMRNSTSKHKIVINK